ncbi:MAG: hypothetical protein SAL07_09300 [Oscillatoria sp. PMC 1051.18]|nr:hypothetical protein [Oscillatoria sp. PMC 1050.18]MEC5030097.1 hypothetical protein [Oscillatoria sp. PMC 1051.18]
MRKIKFWAIALLSFLTVTFGSVLFKRVIAVTLCGILGMDSSVCYFWGGVSAAQPPKNSEIAQVDIFRNDNSSPHQSDIFRNDGGNSTPPSTDIFTNPNLRTPNTPPQNPDLPSSQTELSNTIVLSSPTVKHISSDTLKIFWNSEQGCNFSITLKNTIDELYQESVDFLSVSEEVCGVSSFTARANPEGTRLEVQKNGDINSFILQVQNSESVKITRRTPTEETEVGVFPVQKEYWKSLDKKIGGIKYSVKQQDRVVTEALCTGARRSCAGFATIGTVAGLLSVATAATGVGLAASVPLTTISAATTTLGIGCWLMFGGNLPVPPPLSNAHKLVEIGSGIYDYLGFYTGTLSEESEASYRTGNRGIRQPSDRFFDRELAEVRKELGVDFCDEDKDEQPQTIAQQPSLSVTANPSQVEVNQESIIEVTFEDPTCSAHSVYIVSPTLTTNATTPVSSEDACGGTVKFRAQSSEGDGYGCKTYESGFTVRVRREQNRNFGFSTEAILTIVGREGSLDYRSCYPEVYNF